MFYPIRNQGGILGIKLIGVDDSLYILQAGHQTEGGIKLDFTYAFPVTFNEVNGYRGCDPVCGFVTEIEEVIEPENKRLDIEIIGQAKVVFIRCVGGIGGGVHVPAVFGHEGPFFISFEIAQRANGEIE